MNRKFLAFRWVAGSSSPSRTFVKMCPCRIVAGSVQNDAILKRLRECVESISPPMPLGWRVNIRGALLCGSSRGTSSTAAEVGEEFKQSNRGLISDLNSYVLIRHGARCSFWGSVSVMVRRQLEKVGVATNKWVCCFGFV
jgi:hypothetical protein